MSDSNPPQPDAPEPLAFDEPAGPPIPPSYSEPYSPVEAPRSKRPLVIGAVAVATLTALGGGAFAAWWFLSGGGPQPEEALPASTVAMVSVDLDPSAGQKIEAIKVLRKFPKFTDELDIDTKDDLREFIFEKALGDDCEDLSFDKDLKPWVGERAAFAVVDLGEDDPVPTVVLAITDKAKAKTGIDALIDCAGSEDDESGYAYGDDFVIFSDTQKHADRIFADGKAKPLSEDKDYQRVTDKMGDRGVINFFVAKGAADLIADELSDLGSGFAGVAYRPGAGTSAPSATGCNDSDYVSDSLKSFSGLAGTVRFSDGGMELEAVSLDSQPAAVASVGKQVEKLPADTTLAFGASVPERTLDEGIELMESCEEGLLDEIEDVTGLDLPEDLKTLLGTSLVVSVGGDFPDDLNDIDEPSDVPVGLVINGDAEKITDLIDRLDKKLEKAEGVSLDDIGVLVESHGDKVVITPSEDYADALAEDGTLGASANFKSVVPDAGRAASVFYLNFESTIRDTLLDFAEDEGADPDVVDEIEDNLKPLRSLGFSSWRQGAESHFLLKVATD